MKPKHLFLAMTPEFLAIAVKTLSVREKLKGNN